MVPIDPALDGMLEIKPRAAFLLGPWIIRWLEEFQAINRGLNMCHVLVIEDDWLIADHIARLAEESGATSIAQANTQVGAVEAARERRPGVIFSDVELLAGTGPLAVQTILAEFGDIPVIFVTGTPKLCTPCAPPGIVLSKPIIDDEIRDAFRRFAPHD